MVARLGFEPRSPGLFPRPTHPSGHDPKPGIHGPAWSDQLDWPLDYRASKYYMLVGVYFKRNLALGGIAGSACMMVDISGLHDLLSG